MNKYWLIFFLLYLGNPISSLGVEPDEILADATLESRARVISKDLRCLVCQNQTVADSNAGLAVDLRNQVANQISSGKTDDEILAYMEERYGEFVLYNPQMSVENLGLWIGPFVVVVIAILIASNTIKKHSNKKN